MQDLKKQAADAATETSKKGKKYSDSTQKETLKKLQSSQGYASKQLEALKKEADAQYKSAQVATKAPTHLFEICLKFTRN